MKKGPNPALEKSLPGRLANALPFVMTVLFLGGWSAGFYALQEAGPGTIGEGLRCLAFFGGLAAAAFLGGAAGAFLKRLIWRKLSGRGRGKNEEMPK
jgi:hypothetical protein